jgi:hypothetical protein
MTLNPPVLGVVRPETVGDRQTHRSFVVTGAGAICDTDAPADCVPLTRRTGDAQRLLAPFCVTGSGRELIQRNW